MFICCVCFRFIVSRSLGTEQYDDAQWNIAPMRTCALQRCPPDTCGHAWRPGHAHNLIGPVTSRLPGIGHIYVSYSRDHKQHDIRMKIVRNSYGQKTRRFGVMNGVSRAVFIVATWISLTLSLAAHMEAEVAAHKCH